MQKILRRGGNLSSILTYFLNCVWNDQKHMTHLKYCLNSIYDFLKLFWKSSYSLSVRFSSVAQSCPTLCNPMNHSTPGLPVHHQLPEFTQTHVHRVGDAIQPSHPLSSTSPPTFNLSQHQGLFKSVSSSQQVAIVLELQLQQHYFQWIFRTDFL